MCVADSDAFVTTTNVETNDVLWALGAVYTHMVATKVSQNGKYNFKPNESNLVKNRHLEVPKRRQILFRCD
jgi:hypothetical protein